MKGGRDPFTGEQETEEWFVTQIPYERIIISGKSYVSTEAIKLLTNHNVNITLTDTYGNLVTAMHKVMSSPTATNYRMVQYDTFRDSKKTAYLQKHFLKAKLESQIQFLRSANRSGTMLITTSESCPRHSSNHAQIEADPKKTNYHSILF